MLPKLRKLACTSAKLRRGLQKKATVASAVGRNLDRIGKAGLATIPVAAGVSVAKKNKDSFNPDVANARMGLYPGQ